MESYDVIIVGAGPAGLSLARELAPTNYKILLLDKKKNAQDVQYDTAGSFIDPAEWDLPKEILNPIDTMTIFSAQESASKKVRGYVINRKNLLSFLERAASENKNFKSEYGVIIEKVIGNEQGIAQISYQQNGASVNASAKIFVDCSGNGIVLGRKAGLLSPIYPYAYGMEYLVPLKNEPHVADLFIGKFFEGGYGWLFPLNSEKAIIGFGTHLKENFKQVEETLNGMWQLERVASRCEFKILEKKAAVLRTGKPLKQFSKGNIVLVGDSAFQVNPLVGEGIRFVMDASRFAAKSIQQAIEKNDLSLLKNYGREWKKKYFRSYTLAHYLSHLVKKASSHDRLLDFAVRKLNNASDENFVRFFSGDLSYSFLIKQFLGSLRQEVK